MPASDPVARLEQATCFRCGDQGRLSFTAEPFGVRRCRRCGLVFISPRLDLAGRNALYDDADYFEGSVYSGNGHHDERGLATFWQHRWAVGRLDTLDGYRRRPPGRMLEVGCAYGLFAGHAIERGWKVAAMDVSEAGVRATVDHLGIEAFRGHLEDAPFDEHTFDALVAWDVIEHVPDPAAFLARASRLLVPGGTLALSLPNVASLPARLLRQRWWTLRPDEHIWHFSPRTLALALHDAGFDRVALTTDPTASGNLGRLDSMLGMATAPT